VTMCLSSLHSIFCFLEVRFVQEVPVHRPAIPAGTSTAQQTNTLRLR
jgi:hypothetical protein